jgi:hypothetical protein
MNVDLDHEESASVLAALRTYCTELRSEIVHTDDHEFKDELRHEREVLERVLHKLDAAATSADEPMGFRLVAIWTT